MNIENLLVLNSLASLVVAIRWSSKNWLNVAVKTSFYVLVLVNLWTAMKGYGYIVQVAA